MVGPWIGWVACSGPADPPADDPPDDTPSDTAAPDSTAPTDTSATTGPTTTTPTGEPTWDATFLEGVGPGDVMSNGAVVTVDDEVWLTWERTAGGVHAQRVQRIRGGEASATFEVGGPLPVASFVAAIAAHPAWPEIAVQKLVVCDPKVYFTCARVPNEVEIVWIDRETLDVRIEPVAHRSFDGWEKGRGTLDLVDDRVVACFKAKHRNQLKDEVLCVDRPPAGAFGPGREVSGNSPEADDHPAVAVHADGRAYVLFTSGRTGTRSTWLGVDGPPLPMHDPAIRSEDPVLLADAGALVAGWAEDRAGLLPDVSAMVFAECAAQDCGDPATWQVVDVEVSADKVVAPSLTVAAGRPVLAYGVGPEVHVAIRCDDGWRVERPWDHDGLPQWTKHGQPAVAAAPDGSIHLAIGEKDAAGNDTVWWGHRTGALCP